jgi:SAM-dependent methyltransferase
MTHWSGSTRHLYDRADEWLTKYGVDAYERLQPRRDEASGEERFTELVQQHVSAGDTVVDIGTGDAGWLVREVAPHVRRAIGLDYAARRLWHGAQRRATVSEPNVELLLADGMQIPLRTGSVDAILSRRGPWSASRRFTAEGVRILRTGGLVAEIGIGERNGRELESFFGQRSQMHAALSTGERRIDSLNALCTEYGLQVLVAEEFSCHETFGSREALLFRLETTPAIDGFDPVADAPIVDAVIERHGLSLTVHRLCVVCKKPR